MSQKFVNREEELSFLKREYEKPSSSLVVIYGRRRIGKTTLIKKFIQEKPALYFLASEEMEGENKKQLQAHIAEFTGNSLLETGSGFSWESLFHAFKEYRKNEKKVLIIDEFQYLGKINNAFPSIFQKIWDNHLKMEKIMVILCGSLIHMMESQTLSYSSPLYGRRTGQIKLQQIPFSKYPEFFINKDSIDLLEYYAVTGGVPKYIEMFDSYNDLYEAIEKNILSKQSFLFEEPIFLLEKEVQDIGSYFSVIKTIANGNHKLGPIASNLGVVQTQLTRYLRTLMDMDILERIVPVTEKNPEKSKKGLYFIKDCFLDFWFKFIYPYKSYIEMEDNQYVMNRIRNNFIDRHVSFIYEKVCMQHMWELNKEDGLPFKLLKLGKWWSNHEEIDLIGLNDENKKIIFGECKYWKKAVDTDVFFDLVEKSNKVDWFPSERKSYYIIFSKSGFTESLMKLQKERENLFLISEI